MYVLYVLHVFKLCNQVSLLDDNLELDSQSEAWLYFRVTSGERHWTIRRTYDSLYAMDVQLHRCIYDRRFSLLPELTKDLIEEEGPTVSDNCSCSWFAFSLQPVVKCWFFSFLPWKPSNPCKPEKGRNNDDDSDACHLVLVVFCLKFFYFLFLLCQIHNVC